MARKEKSNSISVAVKMANYTPPEPPESITLTKDEQVIWNQICKARQEWLDFELILLSKVVKFEVTLRKWWKQLAKEQALVENPDGKMVENPLIKVINSTQQTQLAVITKMHIMDGRGDARTMNKPVSSTTNNKGSASIISLLA